MRVCANGPPLPRRPATTPPSQQSRPLRRILCSPGTEHSRRRQLSREGSSRGEAARWGLRGEEGTLHWHISSTRGSLGPNNYGGPSHLSLGSRYCRGACSDPPFAFGQGRVSGVTYEVTGRSAQLPVTKRERHDKHGSRGTPFSMAFFFVHTLLLKAQDVP